MLEKMTESQHSRFREAVRKYCPYRHHMCDGRAVIRDSKRKEPCPFLIDGSCTKSEIVQVKENIWLEMEKKKQ